MWKDEPTPDPERAVLSVDRAIADLRRGQALSIEHEHDAYLAAAVETAPTGDIARLLKAACRQPHLVITAQRAAVLGLTPHDKTPMTLTLPLDATAAWAQQMAFALQGDLPEAKRLLAGVQARPADYAEAMGVQLAKFARLLPAVLMVPADSADCALAHFATSAGMLSVHAADIAAYPRDLAHSLRRVSQATVPLADVGETQFVLFRAADGMTEHLAILIGTPPPGRPTLVRLHSACLTGDIFGSLKCDCGEQLRATIRAMADVGGGVLLYLAQEGRGIGLANKLRAYALQATGYDTLDADAQLGFEQDERRYEIAAEMLKQLGLPKVRVMTNNPSKISALEAEGLQVIERVPVLGTINPHNACYLHTKARRAGHLFEMGASQTILRAVS